MDEMRSEIRAAFEKEQMAHAPAASLRRNIVDAVSTRPRQAPNFQWVAVAAAVLLGILVVVGLMSTRFNHRASVPVTNPKASPVADYGPPPAGVPLLYVHDPNHPSWLIGYDWSGIARGTVKLDQAQPGVRMAPDGQTFGVLGAKGGIGQFLDRLGRPITGPNAPLDFSGGMWADDNLHLCSVQLNQQTFEWILDTQLPGEAVKRVAVIARDAGVGQSGVTVIACSFKSNVAIALRTTIAWPAELWVIRLTDGSVLAHRTYPFQELATVVASADGEYLAENSATQNQTQIRRVSDWTLVKTHDTGQAVAFSSDDSLVLLGTTPVHLQLMDWKSGQVTWQYADSEVLFSWVAQPDGRGFALAFGTPTQLVPTGCGSAPQTPCRQIEDPLRDVVILHADGSETDIPGRYQPTW
jgi:hypothetical protein